MQGWIKMHRKILENEIWQDVTAFRLFTLLLLKASHKDGIKTAGITVNRGQYLRSYSKLSEDLSYMEGRGLKKISKSTIERKVKKLVDEGIVSVSETLHGTLFTILKYESYQGFEEPEKTDSGTVDETKVGRPRDDRGTKVGQEQELKHSSTVEKVPAATTTPFKDSDLAIVIQTFEANLCRLSPNQADSLFLWLQDFNGSTAILLEAIKIADNRNRRTFGFMENILKEWSSNKLTNLDQIQSYERNKFGSPKGVTQIGINKPSNQGSHEQQSRIREANERRKRIAGIGSN